MAARKPISATFSISGAAEILQRNRRTITRALRGIRPDSTENGNKTWRMSVIVRALNEHSEAPILKPGSNSESNADCAQAFAIYDKAYAAMTRQRTLAQRRKAAKAQAPQVVAMFESMAERDSAMDVDQEHAMLRRNQAWLVLCRGYEKPCSWSQAESHEIFDLTESEEPDAA